MDPISIASIVATTTGTCLSTVKRLYDLREKYKDAPMVIVAICSESTVISASLAQIQNLLLQRQDLAAVWQSRTELPAVLDQALTGCMVIFTCLDAEIQRITAGTSTDPGRLRFRPRLRLMWSESQLNDLLSSIRGQQTAMTLLIQLLQMNTLSEIRNMLQQERDTVQSSAHLTQSLCARNPSLRVASSIYSPEDCRTSAVAPDVASIIAPSELEFDFDDMVVNSQAYRPIIAQAQAKVNPHDTREESTLDELINSTDILTITQGGTKPPELPAVLEAPDVWKMDWPLKTEMAQGSEYASSDTETEAQAAMVKAATSDRADITNLEDESDMTRVGQGPAVPPNGRHLECDKCRETIVAQYIRVRAADGREKTFHLNCFTCTDCVEVLPYLKFFPMDDGFLCETDYFRRLDLICNACHKALRGSYVTAVGKKFHLEHFTCHEPGCDTVFGELDSYYEHDDKVYCLLHYSSVHAELCPSCRCPVLTEFMKTERSGAKELWHPDCYQIHKYLGVQMRSLAEAQIQQTDTGWADGLGNPFESLGLERVLGSIKEDIHRVWLVTNKFRNAATEQMAVICAGSMSCNVAVRAVLRWMGGLINAVRRVAQPDDYDRNVAILYKQIHRLFNRARKTVWGIGRPLEPQALTKVTKQTKEIIDAIALPIRLLIRAGLNASTRSQVAVFATARLDLFLKALEDWETPMKLVRDLDTHLDQQLLPLSPLNEADLCVACNMRIEARCVWVETPEWHNFWHSTCLPIRCKACGTEVNNLELLDEERTGGSRGLLIKCMSCGGTSTEERYVLLSKLEWDFFLFHLGCTKSLGWQTPNGGLV